MSEGKWNAIREPRGVESDFVVSKYFLEEMTKLSFEGCRSFLGGKWETSILGREKSLDKGTKEA